MNTYQQARADTARSSRIDFRKRPTKRLRTGITLLGCVALQVALLFSAGGIANASSLATTNQRSQGAQQKIAHANVPNGDSGTTIDRLAYNCGNDAPTCGQVGESYGYYNGSSVNLMYSENYYCDTSVPSGATTGCEAGVAASANPTSTSPDGTSLGNTTHSDTLYIPVPLFSNPPATQCISTATCIDHPPTIDLSRIASALPGNPSASSLVNVPIPAHNHVVGTRNSGDPEWWNVQVIATTSPTVFGSLTSESAVNSAVSAGTAVSVPTNVFLFFQVLPGTVPPAVASNLTATSPPGNQVATAPNPSPSVSQMEPGQVIDNLTNDCGATAPNCENIGLTHDWVDGQDVDALYTEPYFCDTSVSTASSSGCEAGTAPNKVPPGVSDQTPPSTAVSNSQIDPLYIPVPVYASPPVPYTQCSAAISCIDHPSTIDLSRLSSALGVSNASALDNVPLPSHDHLLTTRNSDQPEWWNVIVIPVTSPQGLSAVETAKSYLAVKALENVSGSGIGVDGAGEVPTNVYLWFQTLPGAGPATPGSIQSNCSSHLSSGSVVASAALDDGTGYYEADSSGNIADFGAAPCYGSLSGSRLNQSIVGMATDRSTGGYWLVAADGGVFSFNAPFYGSTGGKAINKPIVGIASTPDGNGYWLVASDGGIFAYGDATFYGSTGALALNRPIVGMATDRSTGGYWLVASDGGVFSFNAPFNGSANALALSSPAMAITSLSDGSGYRIETADGGVFSYNAGFYGSAETFRLTKPIVAAMNDNSYDGYWLVASDGGVFTFGSPGDNMPFFGSAAG